MKKVLKEIWNNLISFFSMKGYMNQKNTLEENKKIVRKLVLLNSKRIIPLGIILIVSQIAFLVKDIITHFNIETFYAGLNFLNLFAQIEVLVFCPIIIIFTAYFLTKDEIQYKKLSALYISFYICFLIAFVIYSITSLMLGESLIGVLYIIIIFSLVPVFSYFATNLLFFMAYFIPIVTVAIVDKMVINVDANYEVYTIIVLLLCSFLISSYIRVNYISKEYNEVLLEEANEKLQLLSTTDQLTGAANRRGLEYYIYSSIDKWLKKKTNIAVLIIDVDEFKMFNDSYTHIKGDWCLKEVSNAVFDNIHNHKCLFARFGGDEFCIFSEDLATKEEVLKFALDIRRSVERMNIIHSSNANVRNISISIGVSYFEVNDRETFTEKTRLADTEAYNAKANGKNCVSFEGKIYR